MIETLRANPLVCNMLAAMQLLMKLGFESEDLEVVYGDTQPASVGVRLTSRMYLTNKAFDLVLGLTSDLDALRADFEQVLSWWNALSPDERGAIGEAVLMRSAVFQNKTGILVSLAMQGWLKHLNSPVRA